MTRPALALPPTFEFTVTPEHVKTDHRCNARECAMAMAIIPCLPLGYLGVPSVVSSNVIFFGYDPDTNDLIDGFQTEEVNLDRTASSIVTMYDAGSRSSERHLALIGNGLTFICDTEQRIVRLKEE